MRDFEDCLLDEMKQDGPKKRQEQRKKSPELFGIAYFLLSISTTLLAMLLLLAMAISFFRYMPAIAKASSADAEPQNAAPMETPAETASVSPAPAIEQQEAFENESIEAALLARSHIIEGCTVTFYCNERYPHICGTGDGIAADGTPALSWATCAVDQDVIPLGSTVIVDLGDGYGLRTLVANDTGVNGNHLDICVGSHKDALQLGHQTAAVYWCEE